MSYFDVLNKAYELVVVTDELTGISYLQPSYKMLLRDNEVHLPGYDSLVNNNDPELWEAVKLEVDKRNAMLNFMNPVAEWMYSVLANVVDPAITNEENELMKNVLEYMKQKENKSRRKNKNKQTAEETKQIEEIKENKQ